MANNANGHDLYWTGGLFRVALDYVKHPDASSCERAKNAIATMEEFRDACQKQYIAFNGRINGRNLARARFNKLIKSRNSRFFVGTNPPDVLEDGQRQKPGYLFIAELSQGELLDGLAAGGTFESEHAKAFVVVVYSLWDESYRSKIAGIMKVKKKDVICKLMNDVRIVRNSVIHKKGILSKDRQGELVLLPQIWPIAPGELKITDEMLNGLMEQINALRVEING